MNSWQTRSDALTALEKYAGTDRKSAKLDSGIGLAETKKVLCGPMP